MSARIFCINSLLKFIRTNTLIGGEKRFALEAVFDIDIEQFFNALDHIIPR